MLKINSKKLTNYIAIKVKAQLDTLCEYSVERMRGIIDSFPDSGSHFSTGASDWRRDVIDAIKWSFKDTRDGFLYQIGLIGAKELMLNRGLLINYGMGKTLDQANPFLSEYVASKYYDAKRGGFNVYTRPGELVYDYEYGDFYDSEAKTRVEIPSFYQEPLFWFTTVMIEMEHEFKAIVAGALDGVNLTQFIENV
ncbi:MAG: hypothetical protein ACM3O3_12805 [Syntrophothermus sp.]